jgi:hypothetical protein
MLLVAKILSQKQNLVLFLVLYTTDDIKCYQIELTPGFNSELKVESFLFAAYLDNWFRVESAEICAVRGFPL